MRKGTKDRSDYAGQYRPGNSIVHRLPSGFKLALSSGLCVFTLAVREPLSLMLATMLCLAYYFLARLTLQDLWRDIRFFLVQMVMLVALYLHNQGFPEGLWPGMRTSLQILLFFIPGMVFIRTTQASSMMRGLRNIIPFRALFLFFTSLRFVPLFARELREIYMAQKLRGAEFSLRRVLFPRFWHDLFFCIFIPLIVRALKIADEAALSAQARGMGAFPGRTFYDERELEKRVALLMGENRELASNVIQDGQHG
jgi:energy-coupling factor transporter transmembrane protein EcfT